MSFKGSHNDTNIVINNGGTTNSKILENTTEEKVTEHSHLISDSSHQTPTHEIHTIKLYSSAKEKRAKRALIGASCFTLLFMFGELVGGYLAGSLAILTDAAHLLIDIASMLLSLFAMHLARRPADHHMTFGYHRAEILGALASVITIWTMIGILSYEAIRRLLADVKLEGDEVDGKIMTIIGSAGFVVNIIDALILKWGNAPHSHSHGHDHDHGPKKTKKPKKSHEHSNVNVRAAFIHVLGDCFQSLGVIAAALVIWIGNQLQFGSAKYAKSWYNIADPIASLLFGVITLIITLRLLKNIIEVLMERVPSDLIYKNILKDLESIPSINGVHDLHIWSISVGKVSLSAHVNSLDHVNALVEAQKVCSNHGISHTTIQVDPVDKFQCENLLHN